MKHKPEWISNPRAAVTRLLDRLFLQLGARIEASQRRHGIIAVRETRENARLELAKADAGAAQPTSQASQGYSAISQSLNLTRRARALHMSRRGDEAHTIAAALGVSHGEVELLLKLDRILQ
jgi:hypothetical protein